MKKIATTIALSIILFSCKQENKNTKTETVESKKTETDNIIYKKIIDNEKLEEFKVTILKKAEFEGIIQIFKNNETKPIINIDVEG